MIDCPKSSVLEWIELLLVAESNPTGAQARCAPFAHGSQYQHREDCRSDGDDKRADDRADRFREGMADRVLCSDDAEADQPTACPTHENRREGKRPRERRGQRTQPLLGTDLRGRTGGLVAQPPGTVNASTAGWFESAHEATARFARLAVIAEVAAFSAVGEIANTTSGVPAAAHTTS